MQVPMTWGLLICNLSSFSKSPIITGYDWTLVLSIFYLDTLPVFDQSTFGSEVFENNLIADDLWKWGQGKTSGNSYHIREAQSVDDITLKIREIVLTSA